MTDKSLRGKKAKALLKNCPFCGSMAEVKRVRGEYLVECTSDAQCCGKNSCWEEDLFGYEFEEDAVELWNKRKTY